MHLFHMLFNTFLHIINALHLIICRAGGGDGSRVGSTHERKAWKAQVTLEISVLSTEHVTQEYLNRVT